MQLDLIRLIHGSLLDTPPASEKDPYIILKDLTVNMEKCVLAQPTVTFLGHTVDSKGIRLLPEKVSADIQAGRPETVGDVAVSFPASPTS